jgi:hypothetical protein
MTASYQHLDSKSLISLLQTRRKNLAHLEQQAAKCGFDALAID